MINAAETFWSGDDAGPILHLVAGNDDDRLVWRRKLGQALARCRETTYDDQGRKLTQEAAAAHLGVDPVTLSRWERGIPDIKLYDVVRMARLYNMPGDWIVTPPDSISEIERFVAPRRGVAQEAARAAVEAERARAASSAPRPRRGKSRA